MTKRILTNPLNGKTFQAKYAESERNSQGRLVARGTLKHGFRISDVIHREFELQEPKTKDLFDAEADAPTQNVLAFNGALLARQLVRVGTFEGPFTLGMIAALEVADFHILRAAQTEIDLAGEASDDVAS